MYLIDPEKEYQEILRRYRNLMKYWKPKSPEDRKMVRKAFNFAVDAHKDMRRQTGEPYIYHPIEVATIAVKEIGLGTTSVICALLHDVVEDTETTVEDIRGIFGDKVASIVEGLTKIRGLMHHADRPLQAENFKKVLLTLSDDVRVILIKLADRLHNMRTLYALPEDKRLKIASQTTDLYVPLANRLGLHKIKTELEDLALKNNVPEVYREISRKLSESKEERTRFIKKFGLPIKKKLTELGYHFTIETRGKSIASIYQKMKRKEISFEEVYDVSAFRIIIDSPLEAEKADCFAVYSVISSIYRPHDDRLRDWISNPKANGYEALHCTLMSDSGQWVEVQIRSTRMNEIAEKGYAAHYKYKQYDTSFSMALDNWLNRIRELIESPDPDALNFIDDVKGYFFLDEISVFTPQGELRKLPANSTALDFAYAIHTELGNSCLGAKVNKRLRPPDYVLKNGEQVEIISAKSTEPKEEWLSWVITTRAKVQIKNFIRESKRAYAEEGKKKLEDLFIKNNLAFNADILQSFQKKFHYAHPVDLFYDVVMNKITLREVKDFASVDDGSKWKKYLPFPFGKKDTDHGAIPKEVRERIKRFKEITIEEGKPDMITYRISECCHPIPGDDLVGILWPHRPVEIHRTACQGAIGNISSFGENFVKVKWINRKTKTFPATIKLMGIDKLGLINEVSKVISVEFSMNMAALQIEGKDGITEGIVKVYVYGRENLQELIHKLLQLDGVKKVIRMD